VLAAGSGVALGATGARVLTDAPVEAGTVGALALAGASNSTDVLATLLMDATCASRCVLT
jgi:hypothetical protein